MNAIEELTILTASILRDRMRTQGLIDIADQVDEVIARAMQQVQARRPQNAPEVAAVSLRLSSMPRDEKLAGWSAGSTVLADHERHRVMLWISTLRTAKTATGIALDRLADSISDISRWPGETDVTFRDRLQRALRAIRGADREAGAKKLE